MKRVMRNQDSSRRLAFILRHDMRSPLHPGGWLPVDYIMTELGYSRDEIMEIVATDAKGRFEMDETGSMVRALYGHSRNVYLGLSAGVPPAVLYHGTATKYLEGILSCGICARSRQFVHLTTSREVAMTTGARHGVAVLTTVNALEMQRDGFSFYRVNDILWLTAVVPPRYIRIISD